jgi:hypothetical protein
MRNKRGLIGKIFLVFFILIFILLGITAYQAFDLYNAITTQQNAIQSDTNHLIGGDCSKISSIETRVILLESKANSACANPIIYFASVKYVNLPYNCKDISSLKEQAENALNEAKNNCDIKTLKNFTQEKIQEYLANLTRDNYQQYAQNFSLNISNQTDEEAMQAIKDYLANKSNATV